MEWVWITAAIGIFASIWNYLKAIFGKIIGCFITTYEFETAADSMIHLIKTKAKISQNYRRDIKRTYDGSREQWIAYECLHNGFYLYWYGWIPLIVYKIAYDPQQKNTKQLKDLDQISLKVSFIRGTLNFDEWVKEAVLVDNTRSQDNKKTEKSDRYSVGIANIDKNTLVLNSQFFWNPNESYRLISHTRQDFARKQDTEILDNLVYNDEINRAINFAVTWKNNRDWYKSRGMDWKTGVILHGLPGTGKSRLAKALAQKMGIPIIPLSLVGVDDKKFVDFWNRVRSHTPCVALFEDFDNIFHGRVNITQQLFQNKSSETDEAGVSAQPILPRINFSTFINCLDGIDNVDGMFVIITTNNIDKIDEALKNRPGRLDFCLELKPMPYNDKLLLAQKILGLGSTEYEEFVRITTDEPETPAVVEQRCKAIALSSLFRSVQQ